MKVLFVASIGEGEELRPYLAAFGYELVVRRKLVAGEGGNVAMLPVTQWKGMAPAGVPVVLYGAYDELLAAPAGASYLIEAPLRPADAIRVLDLLVGRASGDLRVKAEVSLDAHGLTPAQRQVALYQLSGYRIGRIAEALQVTDKTVKNHLTQIYQRYGVSGSVELRAAVFGQ